MSFSFNGTWGRQGYWSLPRPAGGEIAGVVRSAGFVVGYDPCFVWEQADEILVDPRALVELLRRVERAGVAGRPISTELLIRLAAISLRCGANPEWLGCDPFGYLLADTAVRLEANYQQLEGYQALQLDYSERVQPRLDRFERDETGVLDLSGLQLTELPVADLSQVRSLNLSRNMFTSVPSGLSDLSGLVDLDLSYNPLSGDLDALVNCSLSKLSLEGCGLDSFRIGNLGLLATLMVLNLSHNHLIGHKLSIASGSLMALNLSNTGLSETPEEVRRCDQLRSLNLSWNQIEDVADLACAPNIEVLSLDGNRLQTLPESLFSELDLYQLQVGCNRLTESSVANALSSRSPLRYLFAERNPLDASLFDSKSLLDDDQLRRVSISNLDESQTFIWH